MARPVTAHIRLDDLLHNYRLAKQLHGGNAFAVIKANAYGHGAVRCAQALSHEADGFAVSSIEEALTLQKAGITRPILITEGFFEQDELGLIAEHRFWLAIHHTWQVEALQHAQLKNPVHVWLKVDSGMHRLGLPPSDFLHALNGLRNHPNVASIHVMSHFANADIPAHHSVEAQIASVEQTLSKIQTPINIQGFSLANSAAILAHPQSYRHWSRPGLMLYGVSPMAHPNAQALKPVMTLSANIISTSQIQAGDTFGYGSLHRAEKNMRIGVVACGYADGYPRSASNPITQAPAYIEGKQTRLVGRVSMDMLYVDITDIPQAQIGSTVELWGENIPISVVADAANTIPYELLCNIKRVQFQYYQA